MSFKYLLRGGCACGRNRYIVEIPQEASKMAQVLFDTDHSDRSAQSSLLGAFLRVPLAWYHSSTLAFFPDETHATIRRTYSHPLQQHSKRHFCGFCGTPLTYWSEEPLSEADYIQVTLGSLSREDLGDLEELGLLPDSDDDEEGHGADEDKPELSAAKPGKTLPDVTMEAGPLVSATRETFGIPWFDSMVEGSKLGRLRTSKGSGQSRDGRVTYEWEVVEWTDDDGNATPTGSKRKLGDRDEPDVMEH